MPAVVKIHVVVYWVMALIYNLTGEYQHFRMYHPHLQGQTQAIGMQEMFVSELYPNSGCKQKLLF
jgi:hypothetical protein